MKPVLLLCIVLYELKEQWLAIVNPYYYTGLADENSFSSDQLTITHVELLKNAVHAFLLEEGFLVHLYQYEKPLKLCCSSLLMDLLSSELLSTKINLWPSLK